MKKFKIEAIFHSGMYEYDNTLAYIDLKVADDMFSYDGGVSGIAIKTANFDKAINYAQDLQSYLGYSYKAKCNLLNCVSILV